MGVLEQADTYWRFSGNAATQKLVPKILRLVGRLELMRGIWRLQ